jgi:hypothetical protein
MHTVSHCGGKRESEATAIIIRIEVGRKNIISFYERERKLEVKQG